MKFPGAKHSARITVAIATLDRPDSLARCLQALLSGEVLPAQVLVVDQGDRTEETQAVLLRCKTEAVQVLYFPQAREGLSASRNLALAHASEPIIAVTDDDCIPDEGWVAALERAFDDPLVPDAVTGRVLPFGKPSPDAYAVSSRPHPVRMVFSGSTDPWLVGTGANFAIRREWTGRIGTYDERLGAGSPGGAGEDLDFLYRLLRAGGRILYEPDVLLYHERQNLAKRLATRVSYGRGIGACCMLWLRRGDWQALRILVRWMIFRSHTVREALASRRWMGVKEEMLMAKGVVQGLVYGLSASSRTGRSAE